MKIEERRFFLKVAFTALDIKDFSEKIDWDLLTNEFFESGWETHPIIWYGIKEGTLPPLSERYCEILEAEQLSLRANNIVIDAIIDELLLKAEHSGVEVCLLKGASVSRTYYPDPTLRPMGDIDILIKECANKATIDIIEKMGAIFLDEHKAHKRYIFPDTHEIIIEIHTHLINTELLFQRIFFPENYLENIVWDKMVKIEEGGFKLPLEFEYNYLNLHALKEGYARLKWLIDIALINSKYSNTENENCNKFTKNVNAITNDIILYLTDEDFFDEKQHYLWETAVKRGASGRMKRLEKLLMAVICSIKT